MVEEVLTTGNRAPRRAVAQEVAAEIDWARARRIGPPAYATAAAAAGRRTMTSVAEVADHYGAYEALKRQKRLVDFDDLLSLGLAEMARDPPTRRRSAWRFRHLFVDEFQDVNPLQHALLEAWRDGRDDLCVVGDPHQAIYAWNGADGRWLEDFTQHHPGATVITLRSSHRSSPQIVGLGHAVLTGGLEGAPTATRPDGSRTAGHPLRACWRGGRRRGGSGAGGPPARRPLAAPLQSWPGRTRSWSRWRRRSPAPASRTTVGGPRRTGPWVWCWESCER